MHVSFSDGMYKGSHITGPTHNYLGMKVSAGERFDFEVTILPAKGSCVHGPALNAKEVKPWIEHGVRLAEAETGKSYRVEYAEAVENDHHRPEVYTELARRIILKVAQYDTTPQT